MRVMNERAVFERIRLLGPVSRPQLADATGLSKPTISLALADLDVTEPVLIKLDVEGAEVAAIKGAAGMDAIFVYEDWPRSGMPVTRYALEMGYSVVGFDMKPIRSHAEAFEFNRRTRETYGPSNLVAMRASEWRSQIQRKAISTPTERNVRTKAKDLVR